MATRTNPLVSAATLASAAAIAVATPAIAPSFSVPTPHALSAAKVALTTWSDVLSVPTVEWTDLLFGNTSWGGVLSADNYGDDAAAPQTAFGQYGYVNPWAAYCDGKCDNSGISGAMYLFLDALVNGNGQGYDDSANWSTGVVNYLFEPSTVFVVGGGSSPYLQYVNEGWSAASWYLLQTTVGKLVPGLTVPLAFAYWGPTNLTVFYNGILSTVAAGLQTVPVVGPFAGNSILAYLGDLEIPDSGGAYYQYGLSGALNYWIDIATGAVPFPTASTEATGSAAARVAAATRADSAVAASTATEEKAPATTTDTKPATDATDSAPATGTPAADTKVAEAPAADTKVADAPAAEAPATAAPESTPAAEAPAVSTPAAETPAAEAPAAETPAVKAPESTPAVTETAPVAVPEVKDSTPPVVEIPDNTPAPAKAAPKHPVRDAVEKVGKQITSAINGAKAAKAAKAGAADS